ncbi:MAG: hypothetical protein KGY67_00615 [Candidatus Thermoplasmatota archaeon]|nr:hypothetical protein [Candidatus Thermoplasmatota archaeon]
MNKKLLLLTLSLFLFCSTSVIAEIDTTFEDGKTIENVYHSSTQTGFGPGSDVPVRTPVESGYSWVSSVEPVKATWKFYTPNFQLVYTIEKQVSFKQKIQSGEHAGKWAFADDAVFRIPAFAQKGNWLAKPEITLSDGSKISGVSADNPNAKYIAIPVTSSGNAINNLFTAPWYGLGFQFPPLFWFPLGILWIPALFVGIAFISPQISETLSDSFKKLKEARSKW